MYGRYGMMGQAPSVMESLKQGMQLPWEFASQPLEYQDLQNQVAAQQQAEQQRQQMNPLLIQELQQRIAGQQQDQAQRQAAFQAQQDQGPAMAEQARQMFLARLAGQGFQPGAGGGIAPITPEALGFHPQMVPQAPLSIPTGIGGFGGQMTLPQSPEKQYLDALGNHLVSLQRGRGGVQAETLTPQEDMARQKMLSNMITNPAAAQAARGGRAPERPGHTAQELTDLGVNPKDAALLEGLPLDTQTKYLLALRSQDARTQQKEAQGEAKVTGKVNSILSGEEKDIGRIQAAIHPAPGLTSPPEFLGMNKDYAGGRAALEDRISKLQRVSPQAAAQRAVYYVQQGLFTKDEMRAYLQRIEKAGANAGK